MTPAPPATPHLLDTRTRRLRVIIILGSLAALAPLSIDAYLPGLPELTADLHTTSTAAQFSLTGFVVGISLGQLIIGPWSDSVGRRRPLIVGMGLYGLTSALCTFVPSIAALDVLRFAQGMSGAAGIVLARAVVRDLYSGPAAARFFASLMLVNGLAPILAPVLGAQMLRFTSWRGVFVALAVIGVALTIAVATGLPESHPKERRYGGGLRQTMSDFGVLVRDRAFVGYALVTGFAFAAMFAYISGSSFVLQNVYGLTPQLFSVVFAMNALGIVACAQVSGRLVYRLGAGRLLLTGICTSLLGGVTLTAVVLGGIGLAGVLPAIFLVVASIGLVAPNTQALALHEHGRRAGAASALLGVVQFLVGGLVAPLAGIGGNGVALPMAVVMASCSATAMLAWLVLVRPARAAQRE